MHHRVIKIDHTCSRCFQVLDEIGPNLFSLVSIKRLIVQCKLDARSECFIEMDDPICSQYEDPVVVFEDLEEYRDECITL